MGFSWETVSPFIKNSNKGNPTSKSKLISDFYYFCKFMITSSSPFFAHISNESKKLNPNEKMYLVNNI